MSAGSARLNHTLKTLRERWDIAKEKWSDQVSRDFEKNHIDPLEQQAVTAIRGMEKIAEVLGRVRQECR
ncbi:hypothetical protein ACYOEI_16060 [Singulisphaera rosea]